MIGAGSRGTFTYGPYALAHPEEVRVVAVAEPDGERRTRFAAQHDLPARRCFADWRDLLAAGQMAPAAICTLPDRLHLEAAVPALDAGYDVLLEKPMAVSPLDCLRIVEASERTDRLLMICHVLRYTPFFSTLHSIVESGRLGDIVAVEHRENVAFWHMAHSYVRGNWRRAETSAPMILTKCCHDLDVLAWNLAPRAVMRLHSFGSLVHFRPEHAPPGAPSHCIHGCPVADRCPFFAPRVYLTEDTGWPASTIGTDLSYHARVQALSVGPYGRCVYQCDNDVVDHQVVTMEHAGGAVTTLIMQGHSDVEERTMRYDGTRATLRARFRDDGAEITVCDHRSGAEEQIPVSPPRWGGHGGGDGALMHAFVEAVRDGRHALTGARASLESHLLAFAAEESRVSGAMVEMDAYRTRTRQEVLSADGADRR